MSNAKTMQALDRIDRALARIEAAERAASSRPSPPVHVDADLEARHARLRSRVKETVERLDLLIVDAGDGRG